MAIGSGIKTEGVKKGRDSEKVTKEEIELADKLDDDCPFSQGTRKVANQEFALAPSLRNEILAMNGILLSLAVISSLSHVLDLFYSVKTRESLKWR